MKKSFKEFLTKPGYTEGPRSLICHNGIYYKLDRIFELSLDLPVTKMPLSNLQWLIDANTADPERLKNANINVPIIVTPQGGQYVIIDGYHRVVKALQAGEKFIQARIIFDDILAMSRQGSGPSVGFASNVDDQKPYCESIASTGKKIQYVSYKEWKADLPKSTFHKGSYPDEHLERAQSRTKHLEGIAGTWDSKKNSGWIYSHYLDKNNFK